MNDLNALSSNDLLGFYFLALEADMGESWIGQVANAVPYVSDKDSEKYGWLGQVPTLREWAGNRDAKGLKDESYTIVNQKWESTIDFDVDDLKNDKTGQIKDRINEHVRRAMSHDAKLLSALIEDGESNNCYDGQYFFDTDHPVAESTPDSTTASNDITSSIVLKTAPTVAEMSAAIYAGIQAMIAFKDDQNEPMNSDAKEFLVMVPVPFLGAAMSAVSDMTIQGSSGAITNALANQKKWKIEVEANPRLTWTDKFSIFRTDAQVKSLIRQEVAPGIEVSAKAEGSEYEHDTDRNQFGVKVTKGVGYGFWQFALLYTFTTT